MWKGTGRSGYGEQTILGEYDDWDGLSMNGRQWKNRLTKETRSLSGADYWHQRKALEPKMPEDIPTYVNGRPNISAFADPKPVDSPKRKPKDLMYRVLPQQATIERLEAMMEELEREFDNGLRSLEEYALLRNALDKKLDRAFKALERETSVPCGVALAGVENAYNSGKSLLKRDIAIDYSIIPEGSVFHGLSDGNIFKIFAVKWLTTKKKAAKIYAVVKQIVKEGLL